MGSRCEYAKIMDLREATACLDEYRISLTNIGGMLKPNVAEGELREATEKLNESLIETLNAQIKEALVLSIMIREEMNARHERMLDFPGEWADVLVALNQLSLATDRAAEARAEYLRKAAASNANPVRDAVEKFRRTQGLMGKEESEEYDRKMSQKSQPDLVETLNTNDRTEV
jgi:hypothetical protein